MSNNGSNIDYEFIQNNLDFKIISNGLFYQLLSNWNENNIVSIKYNIHDSDANLRIASNRYGNGNINASFKNNKILIDSSISLLGNYLIDYDLNLPFKASECYVIGIRYTNDSKYRQLNFYDKNVSELPLPLNISDKDWTNVTNWLY